MEFDIPYNTAELLDKLNLKSRETFRKNYLNPALEMNLIRMTVPDKPTSRNQRYIKNNFKTLNTVLCGVFLLSQINAAKPLANAVTGKKMIKNWANFNVC